MISGHLLYSEIINMWKYRIVLINQTHWEECGIYYNCKLLYYKDCFFHRSSKSLFKALEKMESWCLLWGQWSKTSQKKSLIWLHQPLPRFHRRSFPPPLPHPGTAVLKSMKFTVKVYLYNVGKGIGIVSLNLSEL